MKSNRTRVVLLVGWSILACAVAIWLCDMIFQPVPIPVGGAVVLGVLAFWIFRRSARATLLGAAVGLLGGAVAHALSHVLEDRVDSVPRVVGHVLADAALSATAAAVILAIALIPAFATERHRG